MTPYQQRSARDVSADFPACNLKPPQPAITTLSAQWAISQVDMQRRAAPAVGEVLWGS
jgi:hypothetical protein